MSSADPEEVSVEIAREGISVEKSFEPDDFPVPAIAFVIRSERDVPVDVTLVDTVPNDIQAEDIGFHPKYGAEHWHNDGDRLIFERTFEAGEEYTTVYGLRARDTEDVGRFLGDPELSEIVPQGDSSQVIRDVINEDEGGIAGASDDDLEAAIAAADVADGAGGTATSEPPRATDGASPSPDRVVSALAEGIRTGQVADSDLDVIRDALVTDGVAPNSLEVRIDHLQNEVADLDAYTAALEEFIDENGDAQTILRDIRESVDEVQSNVAEVRSDVTEVESEVESISGEVTEASDRVASVSETVTQLDDEVERVGTDLEDVGSDVSEVESSVENVESRLDEFETSLSEFDDEMKSLEEELAKVNDEVEDVRGEIPEGRIDGLEERMDDVRGELEELSEMRKRMASVFGGMGGGAGVGGGDESEDTGGPEATDSADDEE